MPDAPGPEQSSSGTGGDAQPGRIPTAAQAAQGIPVVGKIILFMFYGRGKVVKRWAFGLILLAILVVGGWRLVRSDEKKPDSLQTATTGGNNSPAINLMANKLGSNSPILQGVTMSANNASNPALFAGNFNNPQAPLYSGNTFIYYSTPLPNSVTRDAFESFEGAVSNAISSTTGKIELTSKQVELLASALKDLDQRTSALQKMPDGTTQFGSMVAGQPTVLMDAFAAANMSFTNGDFHTALTGAFFNQ